MPLTRKRLTTARSGSASLRWAGRSIELHPLGPSSFGEVVLIRSYPALSYQPGTFLDQSIKTIPYADFINKELILFSMADNVRSIPSVVDGLKPGQRKVLFGCYLKKLKSEIKVRLSTILPFCCPLSDAPGRSPTQVAQLAGFVSEKTAYHHGEVSLTGTIVGLAQDFVGSNNINLLTPAGQYGTRAEVRARA